MIKIKVSKDLISITGHADYDTYGKDIVCAAVSSVVITSIEGISRFDTDALTIDKNSNQMNIIINKKSVITDKLIVNMITCLKELEKQYPKNIKIIK